MLTRSSFELTNIENTVATVVSDVFGKQKVVTSVTTLSHSQTLNNRGGLVNFYCLAKRAVINISIESRWAENHDWKAPIPSFSLYFFCFLLLKLGVCKLNQHRKLTWASLTHVWSSSWTLSLSLIQLLLHGHDRPTYLEVAGPWNNSWFPDLIHTVLENKSKVSFLVQKCEKYVNFRAKNI